jgi:hypothetical protein
MSFSAQAAARKRAGLPALRWHDLRHTWATWHAQAGTPAIVLQALGGWKDARMVRTYTNLAAIDLLDHANAIRLPTILPAVPVSTDPEVQDNLNVISGVDDGIRTHNNRNHKAKVGSGRNVTPLKNKSLQDAPASKRRRRTRKDTG